MITTKFLLPKPLFQNFLISNNFSHRGGGRGYYKQKWVVKGEKREPESNIKYKKSKPKWTHFISVPLNFPSVQKMFDDFHQRIMSENIPGITEKLFIKRSTIHLTILMLELDSQEKTELAGSIFQSLQSQIEEILSKEPLKLNIKGLENFNKPWNKSRVLYTKITEDLNTNLLRKICNLLITQMIENNLIKEEDLSHIVKQNGCYSPDTFHITLMNTQFIQHNMGSRVFDASLVVQLFEEKNIENLGEEETKEEVKEINFGSYVIPQLHISTRFHFRPTDGFYVPLAIIDLPNTI